MTGVSILNDTRLKRFGNLPVAGKGHFVMVAIFFLDSFRNCKLKILSPSKFVITCFE